MEHRLSGMDEKTAVDIESLYKITSRKARDGEDPKKPRMIKGGSGKLGLWGRTARRRGPTEGKAESRCGFLGTQEAFSTKNDLYFSRLKKYYGLSKITFTLQITNYKKIFIFSHWPYQID
jgi:hypothetical protein